MRRHRQADHAAPVRGSAMLLVLILLAAMALGGAALARMSESSVLVSGNVASKDASLHAAEVGWNTAFAMLRNLTDEESAVAGYLPTPQPLDANGIPSGVDFDTTPTLAGGVGRFTVTYLVERICAVSAVTNAIDQCLVKFDPTVPECRTADCPSYVPKNSRQFRITVRVTEPRGTQTWTQSLVTRGTN